MATQPCTQLARLVMLTSLSHFLVSNHSMPMLMIMVMMLMLMIMTRTEAGADINRATYDATFTSLHHALAKVSSLSSALFIIIIIIIIIITFIIVIIIIIIIIIMIITMIRPNGIVLAF